MLNICVEKNETMQREKNI